MGNKNQALSWINSDYLRDKFVIEQEIISKTKNRGIYGIFIYDRQRKEEYCAYIGRAVNIYKRFFAGEKAHFVKLRKNEHKNQKICEALIDINKSIHVRVLEEVKFSYENYNVDVQYMASRECFYIDKYQSLGQCLEQCPDGMNLKKSEWDKEKEQKGNTQ